MPMLRSIGRLSKSLRQPLRRIESALGLMIYTRERLLEWAALIDEAGDQS